MVNYIVDGTILNKVICTNPSTGSYEFNFKFRDEDSYFHCFYYPTRPDFDSVKEDVISVIESIYKEAEEKGMLYSINDVKVFVPLHLEDKIHFLTYKTTIDKYGDAACPFVIKLGTAKDPYYFNVDSAEKFNAFYNACMEHVVKCFKESWQVQQGINWTEYEEEFNKN